MVYLKIVPPFIRALLPSCLTWRIRTDKKIVYLTFDDGPVPEVTPWVIKILEDYDIKATFFCVGENVRKYPDIFKSLLDGGHKVGNHTFNHVKAWNVPLKSYLDDVEQCNRLTNSRLFRPPHGQITRKISRILAENYSIIMWSVLSGDFDLKMKPEACLKYTSTHTREGSIVVFHDSIKAMPGLTYTLPKYIEYCRKRGFEFRTL